MDPRRFAPLVSLPAVAVLVTVSLAACGGSHQPSRSATSATPPKAVVAANFDRYPACMRDHGVTNFPDPVVSGNHATVRITPSITGSPAFASARRACAYLLPAGANQTNAGDAAQQKRRVAGLLAFAECVRKHGFPSFPDPNRQGQLTLGMISQAGIDLKQPAVLQAGDACVSVSHGQITKADVAQAVTDPTATGSQSSAGG